MDFLAVQFFRKAYFSETQGIFHKMDFLAVHHISKLQLLTEIILTNKTKYFNIHGALKAIHLHNGKN